MAADVDTIYTWVLQDYILNERWLYSLVQGDSGESVSER